MPEELSIPTEQIPDFFARLGIKYSVTLTETDEASWTYKVRFRYDARELDVDYEDFDDNAPDVVAFETLDELAAAAVCVEISANLWEWCSAYYGLEPHSPVIQAPEEEYLIQRRKAKDLKGFLGDVEYKALLFRVERLYE
ncbi:MAG TPA: hypothetical protein VGK19_11825 [Capsulimonadaceae bacterium]|jgi:hypothetical protein